MVSSIEAPIEEDRATIHIPDQLPAVSVKVGGAWYELGDVIRVESLESRLGEMVFTQLLDEHGLPKEIIVRSPVADSDVYVASLNGMSRQRLLDAARERRETLSSSLIRTTVPPVIGRVTAAEASRALITPDSNVGVVVLASPPSHLLRLVKSRRPITD